jgi:hypothetical protein
MISQADHVGGKTLRVDIVGKLIHLLHDTLPALIFKAYFHCQTS